MDSGQFQEYTNCLAVIEQNREKVRTEEKARADKKENLKALIKQTTVRDGSSTSAVRVWMKEVELLQNQLSPAHVIELVSQTVNGALRWELERYLKDYVETHSSVAREALPWTELKEHLSASFLHVDETSGLCDEVEKTAQSAYEPEAGYNRRFREVADGGYPVTSRNYDQHRILIKAHARGLKSSDLARKLMEKGAPTTLRLDVFKRIVRTRHRPRYLAPGQMLCCISGTPLNGKGTTNVRIDVVGIPVEVTVVEGTAHEMVLGDDALRRGLGVIDLHRNILRWHNHNWPLTRLDAAQCESSVGPCCLSLAPERSTKL